MESFVNSPFLMSLVTVTVLTIVIAITPGLDFMLVTRNSVSHSRIAGIYSALGIGCSLWVHVAYSIAGLAAIISQSVVVFTVIKYLGAGYLIYIGWKTFSASTKINPINLDQRAEVADNSLNRASAFRMEFFCNLLNPKAPIFFLIIFTQIVTPETPLWLQFTYGAIISIVHIIWFSLVAIFLSQPTLERKFNLYKVKLEKGIGVLLIGFGLKMASANQ